MNCCDEFVNDAECYWDDPSEIPDDLLPMSEEPTTQEVRLWGDNFGQLFIQSDDCRIVVGGIEYLMGPKSGPNFYADAKNWPCWIPDSSGLSYLRREAFFEGMCGTGQLQHLASYHHAKVTTHEEMASAMAYFGDDRPIVSSRIRPHN